MVRKHLILFVFCIVLCLTGCAKLAIVSSPETEAKKMAQAYWDKVITKCGEDYYTFDISRICGACERQNSLIQLKDPEVVTKTEDVNEAAKLNGIERIGNTYIKIKAYRSFFNGKWGEWKKPFGYSLMNMSLGMFRKNGQWYFGKPKTQPHEPDSKAADCTQIPK